MTRQLREDRWLFWVSLVAFLVTWLIAGIAHAQEGLASWYGGGEPLSPYVATTVKGQSWQFNAELHEAAMWDVPLGTIVRVCRVDQSHRQGLKGKTGNPPCVVVRVTDRGPARRLGRIIDLTKGAFKEIADLREGIIRVSVEELR